MLKNRLDLYLFFLFFYPFQSNHFLLLHLGPRARTLQIRLTSAASINLIEFQLQCLIHFSFRNAVQFIPYLNAELKRDVSLAAPYSCYDFIFSEMGFHAVPTIADHLVAIFLLADSVVFKRVTSDFLRVLDIKVLETELEAVGKLNKILKTTVQAPREVHSLLLIHSHIHSYLFREVKAAIPIKFESFLQTSNLLTSYIITNLPLSSSIR